MGDRSDSRLERVDELDGLRGLLALWVAVSHTICLTAGSTIEHPLHLQSAWQIFTSAQAAVETFIILSGFAISFLLEARPQSYLEFMMGRFFRIVPIYLVCLGMSLLMVCSVTPWVLTHVEWMNDSYLNHLQTYSILEQQNLGKDLAWHLVLLHGIVPNSILPQSAIAFLPPAWSISLEWQYYLVAPFIARMVRSNLAVMGLMLLCFVTNREGPDFGMHAFLPQRLDLFLLGIASYHLYAAWCEKGKPTYPWALRLVCIAFSVAFVIGVHSVALQIWAVTFGTIFLLGGDSVTKLLREIRTFLLRRPLQYLGRWSYPLYLVHWPLLFLALYLLCYVSPQISAVHARIILLTTALPLIVGVSVLLHHAVELPFMNLGRRLIRRKPVQPQHSDLRDIR